VGKRSPTSKRRAGRRVREQLRAETWQVVRRNRGFFIRYAVGYLAATSCFVALYVWLGYPRFAWFMGGLLIGFIPSLGTYFLISQGLAHRQMGVGQELGDRPKMIEDVRVVAGPHASTWLEKMREAADRLEIDHPAAQAIEAAIRDEARAGGVRGT
jgi:hypothetical protein